MKYKLTLYIFVFSLICVACVFILRHTTQPNTIQTQKNTVDSYLLAPTFTEYDEKGRIKTKVTANKATHYQKSGETVLAHPYIINYTEDRTPWHIRADQAVSNKETTEIILTGHVTVHQLPTDKHPETTLSTTELIIYPKESKAVTEKAITLKRPGTVIHGTGLIANLKTGQYQLRSQSEVIYQPTSRKK